MVMYEGVGASGGGDIALVSRVFLSDPAYQTYGNTFWVHEFYHTLGLLDGYDIETGISTTEDIMGLGRFQTLSHTYLSAASLAQLGL